MKDFTGVDAPYEAPANPDVTIDTEAQEVGASVEQLLAFVVAACRHSAKI